MAHLSEDPNMVEAFLEGSDIHAATAAKIWHEDIKDVTDAQRKKAKTANFGIIYGITTFGLAQRMNIENREAKQIIEDYFRTFPGVHAYMEKSKEIAREKGYAETLFHRLAICQISTARMHSKRLRRAQCHQCPYPGIRSRHHQGGHGEDLQPIQGRGHHE